MTSPSEVMASFPNPFNSDPQDFIYRTGDLGRLLSDGNIEFAGRADGQIKIRGMRVGMSEIEGELLKYPGIERCVTDYRDSGGIDS